MTISTETASTAGNLTAALLDGARDDVLPAAGVAVSDFRFSAPGESFTLEPTVPVPGEQTGLGDRVRAALGRVPEGFRAVGALPFESDAPAALGIGRVSSATNPTQLTIGRTTTAHPRLLDVQEQPTGAGYRGLVERALRRIADNPGLHKVVLSRSVALEFDRAVDADALLGRLRAAHPAAWVFGATLHAPQRPAARWLGATPELLLSRRGRTVRSFPLAGTSRRRTDPIADTGARTALTVSAKDGREHAVVVEAIADTLAPFCRGLIVPRVPSPVSAGGLWHLGTAITGELRDPAVSSLHLAQLLHPTPALGGWPRREAQHLISELEGRPRGFYGGAIGWCDASGDGTWVVSIRCCEVAGSTVRAQAGAGIVLGSDPAAELAETTAKLGTVLAGLGLSLEALQ